jgi:hypothetical protein
MYRRELDPDTDRARSVAVRDMTDDFDFDFDVDRGRSASRTEDREPKDAPGNGNGRGLPDLEYAEGKEPRGNGRADRSRGNGSRANGRKNGADGNGSRRFAPSESSELDEGDWLSLGDDDFEPGNLSPLRERDAGPAGPPTPGLPPSQPHPRPR